MLELPKVEGGFKTILADPPWPHQQGGGQIVRGAQRHYPLMKMSELLSMPVAKIVAENAHLYLWTTNMSLEDALTLVKAWGFRYVTNRVWVKDSIGIGQYFRGQHELLLFCVKGRLPYKTNPENPKLSKTNISSVIFAKKREHSRKPDEVYLDIEKTSYEPYLELFARHRREGWSAWGNEVEETLQTSLASSNVAEKPPVKSCGHSEKYHEVDENGDARCLACGDEQIEVLTVGAESVDHASDKASIERRVAGNFDELAKELEDATIRLKAGGKTKSK